MSQVPSLLMGKEKFVCTSKNCNNIVVRRTIAQSDPVCDCDIPKPKPRAKAKPKAVVSLKGTATVNSSAKAGPGELVPNETTVSEPSEE